ncbi:hypothetical protein K437DRAFT_259126 [Tilletiaria anomala UBC 951]|uniref:ABC transporter family G domain-containing protein n=1 Tax=Tilletiaria anomala (strain ATCC 24038 / CBS 436.72 / UBC 951) TaxID=1037660 RepID=A0A066VKX7_TILAU|nr:uncharacterized protein K437DRAFT_259126 [Tilletiaria anomala UBC 951]KDN39235.1 hypothetical protein K437DRAFT_259126 [Tilletiaria anomala UBC 951]
MLYWTCSPSKRLYDSRSSTLALAQAFQLTNETVANPGILGVAGNRIGMPNSRGISSGQKRCPTVANGFVACPQRLFLDEPISGLNSASGFEAMPAIKRVAQQKGIIVIVTMYSPAWHTFSLFDSTLLLASGKIMFYGKPSEVAPYFSDLDHLCPSHTYPANHMMRIIKADIGQSGADCEHIAAADRVIKRGTQNSFALAWQRHAESL